MSSDQFRFYQLFLPKKKTTNFLVLCDQNFHLPAMLKCDVPFAFICSYNPLFLSIDGYPKMGCNAALDEREKIEQFDRDFQPYREKIQEKMYQILEERDAEYKSEQGRPIDQVICENFTIYFYPKDVDYYDEETKEKYRLLQIDSPLFPERIPKPFELPDEFAKLPGKLVFVSLGTLFSSYTYLLQRMIDLLEKMPYKYIVSKGQYGHKLNFPSEKFIGENFVNQFAVLQVADLMITHGK